MKLALNLGSGGVPEDWVPPVEWKVINIDLTPPADIIADVRHLSMFEDNVADYIQAFHVLEHLPEWDHKQTLLEWWRVLKPYGHILIKVPNMQQIMAIAATHSLNVVVYTTTEGLAVTAHDIIYGKGDLIQDNPYQRHLCGFDVVRMKRLLESLNFTADINIHEKTFELHVTLFKRLRDDDS